MSSSDIEMGLVRQQEAPRDLITIHQLNSPMVYTKAGGFLSFCQVKRSRVIEISEANIDVNNQNLFSRHTLLMSQRDINSLSEELIDQGFKVFFELMHLYVYKDKWPSDLGDQIGVEEADRKSQIYQQVSQFIEQRPQSPLISWMRSELGRFLILGIGCDKEVERGISLVRQEAENSCPLALFFLGIKYLEGANELAEYADLNLAVDFLLKAAKKEYVGAIDTLCFVYRGDFKKLGFKADRDKFNFYSAQSKLLGGQVGSLREARDKITQVTSLLVAFCLGIFVLSGLLVLQGLKCDNSISLI